MKSFAIMSILALATSVAALPAERSEVVERWTDGGDKGGDKTCNNDQTAVCCNGLLSCLLNGVLGDNCSGDVYCCNTKNGGNSLIDIDLSTCGPLL